MSAHSANYPVVSLTDVSLNLPALDCPLTTLGLALVGAGWLSSYVLSFARMLVDLARPGIPVSSRSFSVPVSEDISAHLFPFDE